MRKQKGTMAKGKLMDIKRESKPDRNGFVEKSVVHKRPIAHTPDNLQELQRTDNIEERVVKNMKKVQCRQTVIRNLPQLQKLDNVAVSSEEMVSLFHRLW